MTAPNALTLLEVAAQLEAAYGEGTELRLRRTGVGQWVASAWRWRETPGHILTVSNLRSTPEAAILDLLKGPRPR